MNFNAKSGSQDSPPLYNNGLACDSTVSIYLHFTILTANHKISYAGLASMKKSSYNPHNLLPFCDVRRDYFGYAVKRTDRIRIYGDGLLGKLKIISFANQNRT